MFGHATRSSPPAAVARRLAATVLSTCALCAQGNAPAEARPPEPDQEQQRQAGRWVRELELPRTRAAAFARLVRLEEQAVPALVDALHDPRPEVAVRAAEVLLFLGHRARAALPALAERAENAEPAVAYACRIAHRRLSFEGIVLVEYGKGLVTVEDGSGAVLREVQAPSVWDAELLADDGFLLGNFSEGDALEVDAAGDTAWSYTEPTSVYDVDRGLDGTTWVTCASLGIVRQVDTAGRVIWESKSLGRPVDVEPLPSGRILVTDFAGGRVLELDRDGTVHWQITDLDKPMDADRLPDGSTLIALFGSSEVRLVDSEGKTVRSILGVPKVQDADLLAEGCIAVAMTSGFRVYDRNDAVIWQRTGSYACELVWALDPASIEAPKSAEEPGGEGR